MQSGHEPGHSSFQVIDGTVSRLDASPGVPRRRWSAVAKERIVAEASVPGADELSELVLGVRPPVAIRDQNPPVQVGLCIKADPRITSPFRQLITGCPPELAVGQAVHSGDGGRPSDLKHVGDRGGGDWLQERDDVLDLGEEPAPEMRSGPVGGHGHDPPDADEGPGV